jgi:hypothetical protein
VAPLGKGNGSIETLALVLAEGVEVIALLAPELE